MNKDTNRYQLLPDKILISYVDVFISRFWKEDSVASNFLLKIDPESIRIYDTLPEHWYMYRRADVIYEEILQNFRPQIGSKNYIVYFTEKYENILSYYISKNEVPIRFHNIFDSDKLDAYEICKRVDFLSKNLPCKCMPIEYDGAVYYSDNRTISKPEITRIDFGNNFHTAQAYFSYDACTYEVYLIRENNKWVFLKYKATLCA